MPPKRKLETISSPSKEETKEEKKKRKEDERAKAKAWAEERKMKKRMILEPLTSPKNENIAKSSSTLKSSSSPPPVSKVSSKRRSSVGISTNTRTSRSDTTSASALKSSGSNNSDDGSEESHVSTPSPPKVTKRRKISKDTMDHHEERIPMQVLSKDTKAAEKQSPTVSSAKVSQKTPALSPSTAPANASRTLEKELPTTMNVLLSSPPPTSSKSRRRSSAIASTANQLEKSPVVKKTVTNKNKDHVLASPVRISAVPRLASPQGLLKQSKKPSDSVSSDASKSVIIQDAPVVAPMERDDEEELANLKQNRSLLSKWNVLPSYVRIIVITLSLLVLVWMGMYINISKDLETTTLIIPKEPTSIVPSQENCFENHGFEPKTTEVIENYITEDGSPAEMKSIVLIPLPSVTCANPKACPPHGRCEGGSMVDCLDDSSLMWKENEDFHHLYIMNEEKNACVVSPKVLNGIQSFYSTLLQLTVEQACSSQFGLGMKCSVSDADIFKGDDGISVAFDIRSVAHLVNISSAENVDHVVNLLQSGEVSNIPSSIVISTSSDGTEYIGLSTDFIQNQLPIPLTCWVRNMLWSFMSVMAHFMYVMMGLVLNIVWAIFSSNPIPALIAVSVLLITMWIFKRRGKNMEARKKVVEIQQMAYDKLMLDCNEGEGYAVLHLRDEIAHQLHPEPCYERNNLVNNIWPKVVSAVRIDNRVTKTRRTIGGKNLEWWEWVAEPARKSRRSLMGVHDKKKEE